MLHAGFTTSGPYTWHPCPALSLDGTTCSCNSTPRGCALLHPPPHFLPFFFFFFDLPALDPAAECCAPGLDASLWSSCNRFSAATAASAAGCCCFQLEIGCFLRGGCLAGGVSFSSARCSHENGRLLPFNLWPCFLHHTKLYKTLLTRTSGIAPVLFTGRLLLRNLWAGARGAFKSLLLCTSSVQAISV